MAETVCCRLSLLSVFLALFAVGARAEPAEPDVTLASALVVPAVTFAPADLSLTASSQWWTRPTDDSRRSQVLTTLQLGFATLQALDAHSTLKNMRAGGVERNPVMAPFSGRPGAMIAVKAAATAGTILLSEKLGRKHRRTAIALMIALNAGYALVVAHNYRIARR